MNFCEAMIAPAVLVTRTRGRGWATSLTIASAMSDGSAFLTPLTPDVPAISSVFTNVGLTTENFTPDRRYSMRAASVKPTTACLLAQ